MARRLFGTDGVRGVAGRDVTEELAERLGRAFALWDPLAEEVLVGRDTRASGKALAAAVARGLADGGAEVYLEGVLPTPAVALASEGNGVVVSASHNPPEYNGVKFFRRGLKLSDEDEEAIEGLLDAPGADGGRVTPQTGIAEWYVEQVTERFGVPLAGARVALDCANGAMSGLAPAAFERLGASVTAVGNEPDGTNINVGCGATDLSLLTHVVSEGDFDAGFAFDGDGDRVIAVDAEGRTVDGDGIVALLALHLHVDLVAVTSMTNLGFHRLMSERGVRVLTTDVGDRYVLEALRREGGVLGGEQSGHVVYLDGHTTGDGLVAALLVARVMRESESPLSELAAVLPRFPQAKQNVPVRAKELSEALTAEIGRLNAELAGSGRILVRASGTEPVIRVLAEAETEAEAKRLCGTISTLVERELG